MLFFRNYLKITSQNMPARLKMFFPIVYGHFKYSKENCILILLNAIKALPKNDDNLENTK